MKKLFGVWIVVATLLSGFLGHTLGYYRGAAHRSRTNPITTDEHSEAIIREQRLQKEKDELKKELDLCYAGKAAYKMNGFARP